jgi:hypothetical protein
VKITKPGLYPDLPDADYRAQHEWLSVSGAKKLLPPSCPAKYKASIGVEEHRPQFDVGKAFHTAVLSDGPEVVVVEADSWRSAPARAARDAAYAGGMVPLLEAEAEVVNAMAAAVKAHDVAPLLFQGGAAEVSAFWVDEATGVQCKARFDYLPEKQDGRRLIIPDLKSAVSSDPDEFARAAARFGYVLQQSWYSDAIRALGIDDDPAFVFVVVEKDEPHVVSVGQFADDDQLKLAAAANDKARRIYRECTATDTWPGRPGVTQLRLPAWSLYALEEIAI